MRNFLIIFILTSSCSQINQKSKDHHSAKYRFPHGVRKVQVTQTDINEQIQIDLKASNKGKALYEKSCLLCHGSTGQGDGLLADELDIYPRDLVELIKGTPNFKFFLDLSKWEGEMPGWWWNREELSSQDLEDITHYLRLLATKDQ